MDKEFDIDAEYEKLHGPVSRKMLFDEEEYIVLRKEIVDGAGVAHSHYFADEKTLNRGQFLRKKFHGIPLPFEGVKLIPYHELMLAKAIEDAKKAGRHLYFLRKVEKEKLIVHAAGYFDNRYYVNGYIFKVLEWSFTFRPPQNTGSADLLRGCSMRHGNIYCEKNRWSYLSPSIAAERYLGDEADSLKWVDDDGLSLAYDKNNSNSFIEQVVPKSIDSQNELHLVKKEEERPKKSFILDEVIREKEEPIAEKKPKKNTHQLFFLSDAPYYQASGYYAQEEGFFYICEGSVVSEEGAISSRRQRFLDKACQKLGYGWKVVKNAKCENATGAAYYVTGLLDADYTFWRDLNGKYLKDYFPDVFSLGGESFKQYEVRAFPVTRDNLDTLKSKIRWGAHAFYLRNVIGESDLYDSKGHYNPQTGQFILKGGSLLSATTKTIKFAQSNVGLLRENIISENCIREKYGYRLMSDEECKDPIYAASIVMGRTINGWEVWKDKKGMCISDYLE